MTNLTVNDRVRLPDGREAKVITVPVFTSRYVTVLVEDEPGEGRACAREAARFRCPRCEIVVPAMLGKDDMCDMCKEDMARASTRWRRPTAATITPKAQNSRPVQCNAD